MNGAEKVAIAAAAATPKTPRAILSVESTVSIASFPSFCSAFRPHHRLWECLVRSIDCIRHRGRLAV